MLSFTYTITYNKTSLQGGQARAPLGLGHVGPVAFGGGLRGGGLGGGRIVVADGAAAAAGQEDHEGEEANHDEPYGARGEALPPAGVRAHDRAEARGASSGGTSPPRSRMIAA